MHQSPPARQHEREIVLGSYELFHRASLIEEPVWQKIMYGLTMRRIRAAYLKDNVADGRNSLFKLHDELMEVNPSAAARLAGLEDRLPLIDLQIRHTLRQCLSSTNGIESSFATVDRICRQVKRWQGHDHRLHWIASALVFRLIALESYPRL